MRSKILAFAGSTRRDSLNKKLLKIAVEGARSAGAEVTEVDLRDLPLPLYDGDLEAAEDLPANARKLKELFLAHQGLLIASPEYNSSISGVLKNVIDWVSRQGGQLDLSGFDGKVAALMSASPGPFGGLRGLVTLRSILGNIRVLVLPDQLTVPAAAQAFDGAGSLQDSGMHERARALGTQLHRTVAAINAGK